MLVIGHQSHLCTSVGRVLPGPRGSERFSDLAQISQPLSLPSPLPAGLSGDSWSTVQSAQRPGPPICPLPLFGSPSHTPGRWTTSTQPPTSQLLSLPSLLKFRWTNKPSRKAAEIPCIYPRVHGLYESTADWTGQDPDPTCFMLSFPGAALSDDWIVQWVSLEELAAVTPPGKKKVPSSTPHQISFADPKGEKSCNPLPQRQHEKLWNFRILTLPLVIRFDLFEAIKR